MEAWHAYELGFIYCTSAFLLLVLWMKVCAVNLFCFFPGAFCIRTLSPLCVCAAVSACLSVCADIYGLIMKVWREQKERSWFISAIIILLSSLFSNISAFHLAPLLPVTSQCISNRKPSALLFHMLIIFIDEQWIQKSDTTNSIRKECSVEAHIKLLN